MEFKKLFQRKLNLAILLFSVYVLLNCSITQTQQRALQNFGETAIVMSNLTSNELITMRNATIQMNMNRIRLENMSKSKEEMNTNEKNGNTSFQYNTDGMFRARVDNEGKIETYIYNE